MSTNPGPEGARPEAAGSDAPAEPAQDATSPGAPPAAEAAEARKPEAVQGSIFDATRFKIIREAAEAEIGKLKAEAERLRAETAEAKDRHVRLLAEMENLRRRTEREKLDTAKYAISKFARDVLTVADNFQRAIDTVPADASGRDPALASFLEGVQLTERELVNVLERHGVRRVDPTGQRFDPNLHQAMMEREDASVPAGTVLQSLQPAYLIEDRILRPATVVISRGGPKPAKAAEEAAPTAPPAHDDGPGGTGAGDGSRAGP
jgi:molecular chaperone GrpE